MLKLTLKPGDFIDIGSDVKVIFSGGSANNIHLLIDAPKNMNIARSGAGKNKTPSPYYREKELSAEARKEITAILMREKRRRANAG